jgi:hypothetical protein
MDHPFLDPKGLTDDQLMDRIQKCQRILGQEIHMGHSTVVDSARAALETYQFEWNERMRTSALADKFKHDEEEGPLEFGIVDEYYKPEDDEIKVERGKDEK